MKNVCLFATPIKSKEIRKGIFAHKYPNGNINIMGKIYSMFTFSEAINAYKKENPIRKTTFKN